MINKSNKAILIFSNERDYSTLEVIKWLKFYRKKYFLISCVEDLNTYKIILNEDFIKKNIYSVWYRKFSLIVPSLSTENSSINAFLLSELEYFFHAFESCLSHIKSLGAGFKMLDLNKVDVLIKAKKAGLNVPDYILCCKKSELVKFSKKKIIITKPIFNARPISLSENETGYMYTSIVDQAQINNLPDMFFPSFFQEFILKEVEIRIFYIDGKFYSGAIYNINNLANFDYRSLNEGETRIVPYNLPFNIKEKIVNLMNLLNLNTGSIDLVKTIKGEYFFLEINPSGQYESLSFNCNFELNKKIAEWLMN